MKNDNPIIDNIVENNDPVIIDDPDETYRFAKGLIISILISSLIWTLIFFIIIIYLN